MADAIASPPGDAAIHRAEQLYAYRSLPDKDLEQYIALYETEFGKWSVDLMNRITVAAFASLAEKAALRVKELKFDS